MKKIGFIGAGNMGGALITAACHGNDAQDVLITDCLPEKANALAKQLGCCVAATNAEIVAQAHIVMLAVVPQVLHEVLCEIAPLLTALREKGEERIVVSMAAGVSVATLAQTLGAAQPILRIMPNTPVAIGKGIVLLTTGQTPPDDATQAAVQTFTQTMAAAGNFDCIAETQMEAATVATGCTPAFAYLFLEALADGAVLTGLPREKALAYCAQAVLGAASMVLAANEHPGKLKDAVCSPGGSTIVGVAALEKGGLRSAAIEAVCAAYHKTIGFEA
ncbi:MAG: pyrroline-5-carboxylate reductase [Ruthenibacterium sp.]